MYAWLKVNGKQTEAILLMIKQKVTVFTTFFAT